MNCGGHSEEFFFAKVGLQCGSVRILKNNRARAMQARVHSPLTNISTFASRQTSPRALV